METERYVCPECKDTGFVFAKDDRGNEYVKPCKCKALKAARTKLEQSGLANEFRSKSFDNYRTYDNKQLIDAKSTAMRFVDTLVENKAENAPSLMLCGQVGAGKTHLGTASSIALINQGIAVVYMSYREEIVSLKSKVIDEASYTKEINRYKKAPVLFIDDFLKGKVTEADVNIVYEIINYRYNNNLPLIISTEKSLENLISFDEAIGSRIIEMCRCFLVYFKGEELNYRLYRGGVA